LSALVEATFAVVVIAFIVSRHVAYQRHLKSLNDRLGENALRLSRANAELETANRELAKAQELRENLTDMIVHDMKSPLTVILGFAASLRDRSFGDTTELQTDSLQHIYVAAKRLESMVMNLLNLSRLESGDLELNRERLELTEVVNEVVAEAQVLTEEEHQRLNVQLDADYQAVLADSALLERILMNLVTNALKHTAPGGEITIGAALAEDREFVQLTVRDTGEGIPPELHERIFDKFMRDETRKFGLKTDTGLGLAFCKLAVEAHGGRIWVESKVGKGSAFHFTLPRARDLD